MTNSTKKQCLDQTDPKDFQEILKIFVSKITNTTFEKRNHYRMMPLRMVSLKTPTSYLSYRICAKYQNCSTQSVNIINSHLMKQFSKSRSAVQVAKHWLVNQKYLVELNNHPMAWKRAYKILINKQERNIFIRQSYLEQITPTTSEECLVERALISWLSGTAPTIQKLQEALKCRRSSAQQLSKALKSIDSETENTILNEIFHRHPRKVQASKTTPKPFPDQPVDPFPNNAINKNKLKNINQSEDVRTSCSDLQQKMADAYASQFSIDFLTGLELFLRFERWSRTNTARNAGAILNRILQSIKVQPTYMVEEMLRGAESRRKQVLEAKAQQRHQAQTDQDQSILAQKAKKIFFQNWLQYGNLTFVESLYDLMHGGDFLFTLEMIGKQKISFYGEDVLPGQVKWIKERLND